MLKTANDAQLRSTFVESQCCMHFAADHLFQSQIDLEKTKKLLVAAVVYTIQHICSANWLTYDSYGVTTLAMPKSRCVLLFQAADLLIQAAGKLSAQQHNLTVQVMSTACD